MTEEIYNEKEKLIQNQLKKISNRKYQVIWAIFVTLVSPFIIPFVRLRRMEKTFGEMFGYWNAVMIFLVALIFLMSIVLYQVIDKMKRDKFDAESDLRFLKKEFSSSK